MNRTSNANYDIGTLEGKDTKVMYECNNDDEGLSESLCLIRNIKDFRGRKYAVIKYQKQELKDKYITTRGLFRSIIARNEKVLVFSPPKGLKFDDFAHAHSLNDCVIQDYIEGTMINLFFDDEWEIATRSNVGGNYKFYDGCDNLTFRHMFLEACNETRLEFEYLDKNICYCFVLQHPKNRIVENFEEPHLFLVACHEINNEKRLVTHRDPNEFKNMFENTDVEFPANYEFNTYQELTSYYDLNKSRYTHVGLMIHHRESGERTKIRNPTYEMVRRLRGNQSNALMRYLELRYSGLDEDYLLFYPEESDDYERYRINVEEFAGKLYNCYVQTYIQKQKSLDDDFPVLVSNHLRNLHRYYRMVLRSQNRIIRKLEVVTYVNQLMPSYIFSSLRNI